MPRIAESYAKLTEVTLNLNHLRVFLAISERGSVTAGAQELHISQPAASKQLAELEGNLGVDLLERRARGIELTAAGTLLLGHARRIFQEERAAEEALRGLAGLERGRLSVGASTTIGNYLVPRVFGQLHAAHPGIALELSVDNTAHIQERLLAGQLDVGLTEGGVASRALTVDTLLHDEIVLITGPARRGDFGPGPLRCAELAGLPLLVREEGSGTRSIVEAALAGCGVGVRPTMTLGSTEALKNAVEAGLGVALVSRLTVEVELRSGRLLELAIADLQLRRELHVVTLKGKPPSPAAAVFLKLLRERYPRGAPQ